jgi:hypothetical protein
VRRSRRSVRGLWGEEGSAKGRVLGRSGRNVEEREGSK